MLIHRNLIFLEIFIRGLSCVGFSMNLLHEIIPLFVCVNERIQMLNITSIKLISIRLFLRRHKLPKVRPELPVVLFRRRQISC